MLQFSIQVLGPLSIQVKSCPHGTFTNLFIPETQISGQGEEAEG